MKILLFLILILISCRKPETSRGQIRVVSLVPSLTEIVYALRRDNLLVGVTVYCNYPEDALKKYKVGDFSNPSLERIVGARPTIVLLTLPEQTRIKNELEKLRIKTYNSSPKTIEDIFNDISSLGQMLNATARADSLIDSLRSELNQLRVEALTDTPGVFIEISPKPLVTVGNKSYINEMIRWAGAKNIFDDLAVDYPVVAQEELIRRNPDIIFILHNADPGRRLGWDKIKVFRKKRVFNNLNPDLIFRPGPRFVEGIKTMHKLIKGD